MPQINIHEAKTHLSRWIEAVENGTESEVVIARAGKPVVKMVRVDAPTPEVRRPIRFGVAKGQFTMPDDFDADNEYIAKLFNGEPID